MIVEATAPVVEALTETAAPVVETVAAPVMATGVLDYKKVAVIAVGVVGVAACAYICKKALDKRAEAATEEVEIEVPEVLEEPEEPVEAVEEEVVEEPEEEKPAKKTTKKSTAKK